MYRSVHVLLRLWWASRNWIHEFTFKLLSRHVRLRFAEGERLTVGSSQFTEIEAESKEPFTWEYLQAGPEVWEVRVTKTKA